MASVAASAGQPGDFPTDQRNDQHIRPRRSLGDGVEVSESGVVEPVMVLNHDPVHFRQQRRSAAESHKGKQREFQE